MIVLYLLAPIVFFRTPEVALLAPGVIALYKAKHDLRHMALSLAVVYTFFRLWTPYAWIISALASSYLIICFLKQKPAIHWRTLLAFTLLEGGLLWYAGDFIPAQIQATLSYLLSTLVFVASEEVFLQSYLRRRFGGGILYALTIGVLWGLWHFPFNTSTSYLVIQILHAAALRLFIESRFKTGGLTTAIGIHATHNALPLLFSAYWTLEIHLLFAIILSVGAIYFLKN